jgi:hypothetical protein
MGEGEANGGDDGMAVGPMGVGSARGQRGRVLNNHTNQLHSKNSAQFYVVRPIHAAPVIPAYHQRQRPFAHIPRTYGRPTDKRPRTAPNRVRHRVPHSI